jgi:hypothetical protein
MTESTDERIHRILLTLSKSLPLLDTIQLRNFMADLCTLAVNGERQRCLSLLSVAQRRITQGKGRNWRAELAEAAVGVERGDQRLFDI